MIRIALFVLVLGLLVPGAEAGLVGSKHDFSSLGGSPCGYCHSVHNSLGGTGLLNSDFGTFPSITKVYTSATRKLPSSYSIVNKSDARICLACHDLTNVVGLAATKQEFVNVKQVLDARNDPGIYINVDLSNDHPVGLVFDVTRNPKALKTPSKAHPTFGPQRNEMWCSSCHNVHDNTFGAFLVASNDGSALCLDCHIK